MTKRAFDNVNIVLSKKSLSHNNNNNNSNYNIPKKKKRQVSNPLISRKKRIHLLEIADTLHDFLEIGKKDDFRCQQLPIDFSRRKNIILNNLKSFEIYDTFIKNKDVLLHYLTLYKIESVDHLYSFISSH